MSALADDGTRENRIHRDGTDSGRGASQTHGAGDPSGVDAEPLTNQLEQREAEAAPPSAAKG